jgi:biopolymer transport protein ExbD
LNGLLRTDLMICYIINDEERCHGQDRACPEPVPFSAINVTPFIDVMLVLLIVMILSVPIATHKVPIDLPTGIGDPPIERPHQLAIDRGGTLFWDGRRIADAELPARSRRCGPIRGRAPYADRSRGAL